MTTLYSGVYVLRYRQEIICWKATVLSNVQISQFQDPEFLTQLTLDASAIINFENIAFIHRTHVQRIRELQLIA